MDKRFLVSISSEDESLPMELITEQAVKESLAQFADFRLAIEVKEVSSAR